MSYDLHITRRRQWSASGPDIQQDEWSRAIEAQPDMRDRLEWSAGNITARNPTPAVIDRMVAIARLLDAVVQGDDGETYESGSRPPTPYRPSLAERLRALLRRLHPARRLEPAPLPPFTAGDTVKDVFGKPATVIEMDRSANKGLGRITIRYPDGREVRLAMRAHHLTRAD